MICMHMLTLDSSHLDALRHMATGWTAGSEMELPHPHYPPLDFHLFTERTELMSLHF